MPVPMQANGKGSGSGQKGGSRNEPVQVQCPEVRLKQFLKLLRLSGLCTKRKSWYLDIKIFKSTPFEVSLGANCKLSRYMYTWLLDIHLEYLTDFFWVYLVGMSGVTFCLVGEGGETESETVVVVAVVVVLACGPS